MSPSAVGARSLLLVAACWLATACTVPIEPRGTAITNVTVIDALGGVREHQTVWFVQDEILAVAPNSEDLPAAETTIDGSGKYLIPGLWDMHVHLTYDDRFTAAMPELFLSHGITSVRDTGGLLHNLAPVIEQMRGGEAPRVFFSGPLLDGRSVVYDGQSRPEIGIQNATPEMAVANVAALEQAGVDFIKIYELVSPEVFAALVESARSLGLPIASHVPLAMLASQAGPAVDSMEHLRNVELDCAADGDDLLERRRGEIRAHQGPGFELRSQLHSAQRLPAIANYDEQRCAEVIASLRQTTQVPTLRLNTQALHPVFARVDWPAALARVPEAARSEWQGAAESWRSREPGAGQSFDTTFAQWSLELVGRMHDQNVPIGAGTDTPIGFAVPGYSLHSELERLVEAGLTPLEAIASATLIPAQWFSLQGEMGAIAVGQKADLVLLDADPLVDIANTRKISQVVSKGRLLVPAAG